MISPFGFFFYSIDRFWILAGIGAVSGFILFCRGFRMLQRKRLILNTPTSKIRSASMGLVEVNGLAVGPYTMPAPITGVSCYYYRTMAWQLKQAGKNTKWQKVADESLHVPFYLDDNTGLVLVNPQGADMDIHRDFHEEYSNSILFGHEIPENVRGFLARYGVSGDHKVKVDEYCIKPKNALFILGTLAENPGLVVSPKPVPTLPASVASVSFNMPGGTERKIELAVGSSVTIPAMEAIETSPGNVQRGETELVRLSSDQKPVSSAEMTQQGKIAAALMRAGITNPAAWEAAGINDPAAAVVTTGGNGTCVASGSSAAPSPAPEQFDLQPKVVLMKGEHDPAFFISWRSQRDLVRGLNWKSALYIWGGPALTLFCVYVLAEHFGWL